MGYWGTQLYANDTTCDVRDTYKKYLYEQYSDEEAYQKTLCQCECYIGDCEEAMLWYALAETMWSVGRLTPEVKNKALAWIQKQGGVDLFIDSPRASLGWLRTLEKVQMKLNSPQPPKKVLRKRTPPSQNLWNIGDVYAFQLKNCANELEGKYVLLQKVGEGAEWDGPEGVKMRVHVYDGIFDHIPSLNEVKKMRLLPMDFPTTPRKLDMCPYLIIYRKKDYPSSQLFYLGTSSFDNYPDAKKCGRCLLWRDFDRSIAKFYSLWKGETYTKKEDGTCYYPH